MIREIVKDPLFLSRKSEEATKDDQQVIIDLLDTFNAHQHECIGMAANMIGINKKIIIVRNGQQPLIMINPVITKKNFPFETKEACLSLEGMRSTKRYKDINVKYYNEKFVKKTIKVSNDTAQAIQHEIDHLNGILI